MQPVDQFIILNEAIGIEAAHPNKRLAAECGKRPGNEQQTVELHPGIARHEIADILIGLEPLEKACSRPRATHGGQHPGGSNQRGFRPKTLPHGRDGMGFYQRVGVNRQDDVAIGHRQSRVECTGLASLRHAKPPQRRQDRTRRTDVSKFGTGKAIARFKHCPHAVGRAIVCYKNQIRSIGLGSQRVDGYCNGAFFVMGSDDDGQGRPRCVGSWWVHKLIQFAGLPSGKGQKAGIV